VAESFINQTEGSGKKSHTWDRTIGANLIQDEFVLPGEFPYATYSVVAAAVSGATAASHIIQIMAGATLPVRVRRIELTYVGAAAAVATYSMQVFRLTTAGTGGTAITPRPYDSADAASGATAMTLPTAKGTEGVQLGQKSLWVMTAAIPPNSKNDFVWEQKPGEKAIIIPAGTANGIAIKNPTGVAAVTYDVWIELVETNFV